jgi:putative ABC transport system permease protein
MIGIFISIATIFILVSLSLGLDATIQEQFRKIGSDKFFLDPKGQLAGPGSGGAVTFTEKDIRTIEKVNGVKEVTYLVIGSAKLEKGNEVKFANVAGIPLDRTNFWEETGFIEAEYGKLLRKGDSKKIDIGSQYLHNNVFNKPVKVGDKLTIQGLDFKVKSNLKTIGNPTDDKIIYMSIEDFRETFPENKRIDQITVQVNQGIDINKVAENVQKKLDKSRDVNEDNRDYRISTPEELLATIDTVLNIITGFLLGVAAISLLVGGIGITNTMYTSVLERRKEIGILKSVGAQNGDVLAIFTIEAGLLGLVGGIIGVIIGIIFSKGLEYIAANILATSILQVSIPVYLIVGVLTFSFLIGCFSGLWPSWQATKVSPVEALRYE